LWDVFVEEIQKNSEVTVTNSKGKDVTQKGCRRTVDWVMN